MREHYLLPILLLGHTHNLIVSFTYRHELVVFHFLESMIDSLLTLYFVFSTIGGYNGIQLVRSFGDSGESIADNNGCFFIDLFDDRTKDVKQDSDNNNTRDRDSFKHDSLLVFNCLLNGVLKDYP